MRILFIGLGSIGQRHLLNLKKLGISDFLAWRVRNLPLPDSLPIENIETVPSLEEGLVREPDAACVCGPNNSHVSVAIQCARAGCNLFIEKPLSHSWDGVEELVSLVKEKKLIGFVHVGTLIQ